MRVRWNVSDIGDEFRLLGDGDVMGKGEVKGHLSSTLGNGQARTKVGRRLPRSL
jgi:hypothetical protein